MRYILTIIIIFFSNFVIVHGLTIEENLKQISQNLQKIEETQNSRNLLNKMYPVGSIYITNTNTNPSNIFGGTWEAYAGGRTLVGVDGSSYKSAGLTGGDAIKPITTSNMAAHTHNVSTSGKVTSTFKGTSVSTSSSGAHIHTFAAQTSGAEAKGYSLGIPDVTGHGFGGRVITSTGAATSKSSSAGSHNHTLTPSGTVSSTFKGTTANTTATGSGSSLNFQNPYITVYIWKRTA